jgi:tetratricopeptide (TPR) repeat protein
VGEHQKAIADYLQVVHLTSPGEKVKSIPSSQLRSNLAAIYHRGLARFHLAPILEKDPWFFGATDPTTAAANFLMSAERDFTLVIGARPEFADAYYQLGRARRTTRKIISGTRVNLVRDDKGAFADFERAIQLNPGHADAYFARGEEFRVNNPEQAILDFKRVIAIDPGNAKAFYHLGLLYGSTRGSEQPDPQAQLNYYNLAIKADPSYVEVYPSRAHLLQEKSPLQAVADLTKIIQLKPDDAQWYRRRAEVNNLLKDYRNALADYTRAIEIDPGEPGSGDLAAAFTYVHRAKVRNALGDGKGAQDDYRQARLIRPSLYSLSGSSSLSQASKAETFLQRGLALMRRGDKQGSRQNLEQAVRLFYAQGDMPKYQNAKYHLSRL